MGTVTLREGRQNPEGLWLEFGRDSTVEISGRGTYTARGQLRELGFTYRSIDHTWTYKVSSQAEALEVLKALKSSELDFNTYTAAIAAFMGEL